MEIAAALITLALAGLTAAAVKFPTAYRRIFFALAVAGTWLAAFVLGWLAATRRVIDRILPDLTTADQRVAMKPLSAMLPPEWVAWLAAAVALYLLMLRFWEKISRD